MGRDSVDKDAWNSYRTMTQDASRKLNQALATRSSVPATVEEAQQFIDSLGFDDRVGQHIENEMMNYIMKAAPDLARQLIGEQKADQANDSSYVQWVKRNATDPEIARATTADILAARTPENQYEFETDINADHFDFDPVTGQPMKRPPRKLTPIEEIQEKQKVLQYQADQDPDLMVKGDKLVSRKEETGKRVGEINKELDDLMASSQRDRVFAAEHPELLTPNEKLDQNNIFKSRKAALEQEKAGLTTGATPATQAPAEGAAPFMTPAQVAAAPAGTRFVDDKGNKGTATGQVAAPPGGKGSITMGGRTVTSADVAPKPGTGSITMGGRTVTNAPAPAVKPVAPAAPYRSPIERREDIIQQAGTPRSEPFGGQVARRKDIVERALKTTPETQKEPPNRKEIEREVAEKEFSESDFDSFVKKKVKETGMTISDWANAAIQGLYGLGDLANQGALLVGKGAVAATQIPRYTIETAQKMTTAAKNKLSITIENMMRAEEVNKRLTKLTKETEK